MSRFRVVISDLIYENQDIERNVLRAVDADVIECQCITPEDVIKACRNADGIIVSLAPFPAQVIQKLTRCKVISRYGIGYDNIDIHACTQKGIHVANVPDYCQEEVSDHALALLMSCSRRILQRDRLIHQGGWRNTILEPIYRMAGKTFAFLGFGMIARCLHRKIQGLNFGRILVYDPYLDEKFIRSLGAEKVDYVTALQEADYISIHMPLNDQTRGMIDEQAFGLMKKTAVVINTSRGAIIDEQALVQALQAGKIFGAGLDVFEKEPLSMDNPLLTLNNCILTDHMSWFSEESILDLKRKAAENVRNVLNGEKPLYPLNQIL